VARVLSHHVIDQMQIDPSCDPATHSDQRECESKPSRLPYCTADPPLDYKRKPGCLWIYRGTRPRPAASIEGFDGIILRPLNAKHRGQRPTCAGAAPEASRRSKGRTRWGARSGPRVKMAVQRYLSPCAHLRGLLPECLKARLTLT